MLQALHGKQLGTTKNSESFHNCKLRFPLKFENSRLLLQACLRQHLQRHWLRQLEQHLRCRMELHLHLYLHLLPHRPLITPGCKYHSRTTSDRRRWPATASTAISSRLQAPCLSATALIASPRSMNSKPSSSNSSSWKDSRRQCNKLVIRKIIKGRRLTTIRVPPLAINILGAMGQP